MFLHGDLIHLSGNMVFLLVFGQRVESEFGAINFLAFYMTTGVTGCLAHAIVESESTKPLIGASGAISGVLGAFLIANPRARITLVLDPTLIYFLRRITVRLPAWIFLLGWFLLQLGLALKTRSSNIAFWAHVGGFVIGTLFAVAIYRYIPKRSSDRELA
jgi:membrane associated rhomboid family serine protease